MKNVFTQAFTNITSLFTPPAQKKRPRLAHQEGTYDSELAANKSARTWNRYPTTSPTSLVEADLAQQTGHTPSGLPLSRPAIAPAGSLEQLQLEFTKNLRSHQQQQAKAAAQQQPPVTSHQGPGPKEPQASSWQVVSQRPSPLSKVTYAHRGAGTFGSSFTGEGSGLKLLQDEPNSCWQKAAQERPQLPAHHQQAAPLAGQRLPGAMRSQVCLQCRLV